MSDRQIRNLALIGFMGTGKSCVGRLLAALWRVNHQMHRPLLIGPDPQASIVARLAQREPVYRRADVLVNTETRSARQVAHQVLHEFCAAHPDASPR